MEKMVENRTKLLWDISIQAAMKESKSNEEETTNEIQTEDESVHNKIKAAYGRAKNSYKIE